MERVRHWDGVYRRLPETEVSWFQDDPSCSLELIDAAGVSPARPVIDVGAGASRLVDGLLARGFTEVTALDISDGGLAAARRRLGTDAAARVRWLVADLLSWEPDRAFACWHDRAVFHFLVQEHHRARYRDLLAAALAPGGTVLIGTFADDGPRQCSGLPTAGYSAVELARALGDRFDAVDSRSELHRTPAGGVQPFTWLMLRRSA
ncbi:MAG: class I SAM-dependent methyltransferase [Pseudonocardia sp.]|jgi:SAM-dependent methyltransferase